MTNGKLDQIAADMDAIKKLLILDMARNGVTLSKIADALGIHKTTVSRMFPKGTVNAIVKKAN